MQNEGRKEEDGGELLQQQRSHTQSQQNFVSQNTTTNKSTLSHVTSQKRTQERQLSLQKRVEQALKQANMQFTSSDDDIALLKQRDILATNDDQQRFDTLLNKIHTQLQSIPKLSRSQFMDLPKEQREEYIRVIERLAAQSSVVMKMRHDRELRVKLQHEQQQKRSYTTMDDHTGNTATTHISSSVYNQSIGTNVVDHRNAHYTVQAIEQAAKKEFERRQKLLNEIRNAIIHRDYTTLWLDDDTRDHDLTNYGRFVSAKRLLHRLKYKNIDENNKQKCIQFIRENCSIISKLIGFSSNNSSNINLMQNQSPEIFDWLTHAAVILNDWYSPIIMKAFSKDSAKKQHQQPQEQRQDHYQESYLIRSQYAMEECFLFTFFSNDKKYLEFNRSSQGTYDAMDKLRNKLEQTRIEVQKYNEQISIKWKESMSQMDKLKHYIKREYRTQFETIVQQGYDVGLSDEKIISLFLSQALDEPQDSSKEQQSQFFTEEFFKNGKSLDQIPLRKVPHDLEHGVHTFSLELSKKINIPERVLVQCFLPDQLRLAYRNRKNTRFVDKIYSDLGFSTILPEFKQYWKEITVFDSRWQQSSNAEDQEQKEQQQRKEPTGTTEAVIQTNNTPERTTSLPQPPSSRSKNSSSSKSNNTTQVNNSRRSSALNKPTTIMTSSNSRL